MVDSVAVHPVQVGFVRVARATPKGARMPRELPVVGTCMALVREFAEDDAPVAVAFGDGGASVVRRVGEAWYASYGAVGRDDGRGRGPRDLEWLARTCARIDGPHPFDGSFRSWGVTSHPDFATARPEGDFRQVEPVPAERVNAIREALSALALVDGELLREVREPVLEVVEEGVRLHLVDARHERGVLSGRTPDEDLLERAPHRVFSLGDLGAIDEIHGTAALGGSGLRPGPAPAPPSMAPRAAAAHLRHIHGAMRVEVADRDEAYFAAYRRLRAALAALDGAELSDPGAMADMRAAILDAEAVVAATAKRWSTEPGRIVATRLELAAPDLALSGFTPA